DGEILVTGTASDNAGVKLVEVAVNDGPFVAAKGTTSWQTSITDMKDGMNTITVRAIDDAGNIESASALFRLKSLGVVTTSWKGLHGVNFIDPVLRTSGNQHLGADPAFVNRMVDAAADADFNVFRIPIRWNAYVYNEDNFVDELDLIARTANDNGIAVWVEFHHFDTTSHWKFYNGNRVLESAGNGFPEFVVKCYVVDPDKSYERDPAVLQFWDDYYANKVKNSINNCEGIRDVWEDQASFMEAMIQKIDHYPSVLGYEILNEPHVWRDSHYDRLGDLHTVIGGKLRESTDKTIIFTRETAHGYNTADGGKYSRRVSLEDRILPRIEGEIRYIPHLYDLEEIEQHIGNWKSFQKEWRASVDLTHPSGYDVLMGVGEWATQPPQLTAGSAVTQKNMDGFVSVWAREDAASSNGFPVTYWAFGICCSGEGNRLVNDDGTLTEAGRYYKNAIAKYYK
ncbi:MAG TPA: cellulase family glycosylhydrolase, partial [Nitrososphaera sp.]|nr:cellulase family glycosylhydrolase [Nitrososphaera sp.]